jgi:hypothetical protein
VPSLGSFGRVVAAPAELDTFEFFGLTVRIDPTFGELSIIDFFESHGDLETSATAAMVATKEMLRVAIVKDDFDSFWEAALLNRQSSDDLMAIYQAITEAIAGRPTSQPSVSTVGLEVTPLRSVSPPADPAMDRLSGRGDLQSALLEARQARSA